MKKFDTYENLPKHVKEFGMYITRDFLGRIRACVAEKHMMVSARGKVWGNVWTSNESRIVPLVKYGTFWRLIKSEEGGIKIRNDRDGDPKIYYRGRFLGYACKRSTELLAGCKVKDGDTFYLKEI